MAEFKLGRIKFVWKDNWVTGTTYYKDDIVAYGGKTYLCVVGHTAAADFYTDVDNVPTKWNQFSDGQDWKGNWSNTTLYKENDIVKYGGYVYICNNGHTSSTTLELNQSDWDLFAESLDWKGDWVATTVYKVNDLVKYGGNVYICNTAHTAAATNALGLEDDQSSWDLFSKGIDWKGAWTTSTRYKVGDLVKFGGTTYVCNQHHTSASTESSGLEVDQAKWDYFNSGIEYKGNWLSGTRYKINDVVKNGGGTWICMVIHTAASNFTSDVANWSQFVEGIEFEGPWATSITYQPGDIVRYGGNSYIAKTAHISSTAPSTDSVNYDLFSTGFNFQGDWNSGTTYKVGEVVRNNGYTYVATADGLNHQPPNASYWDLLNQGMEWQGAWTNAAVYILGDTVKYNANSYICVQAHTASAGTNRPDIDTLGTYWNLLTAGNEESALTTNGDLVYYSGAGPTRLPIGDEGQVLTVENGLPTWQYFGQVEKVFYTGPNGTDEPAPTFGLTIDKPFASVRYALEQIEKGYENPNAAYLMNINRTFIQKEIIEWTNYQITNNIAPFTSGFTYDQSLCQRDMGLLVDAIVWDLTHTGNSRTIEAAEAYFTALGASYIAGQEDETIASINYGIEVIAAVLSNSAPAANYQTLNGISAGNRIKQIIDSNYTAESTVSTRVSELVAIVTDAIAAGDTTGLPVVDRPGFTLNVKTGQYYEVLPMIVPANTAIVGDELRSTRVSPAGKLIASNDKAKSIQTLQHIQDVTASIVTNTAVTPTSGNSETQDTTSQKAATGTAPAVTFPTSNILEMKKIIEFGDSFASAFVYPNPTNYNTSYLIGYGDARAQLVINKAYIQTELTAWIAAQVSGNIAPFTSSFTYDSAACERDVGYIVDALIYDLTYGGNLQTTIAARSYFSNGSPVYGVGEKDEVLAAYARLKAVVGLVIAETYPGQNTSGTAGSAGSITFAQDRVQEIIETIGADGTLPTAIAPSTSWVSTTLTDVKARIDAAKKGIQFETIKFINDKYPELVYDEDLCSRDVGYIVDALAYDYVFGSNFSSIKAAMAYRRGLTSTGVVLASQLKPTLDTIEFVFGQIQAQARMSTAGNSITNNCREIRDILNNGLGVADAFVRPTPTSGSNNASDAGFFNAARLILANKAFLVSEVSAWINAQISGDVAPFVDFVYGGAGQTACERDVGYIVEALVYDLTYGGNLATQIAGRSYYSNGTFVETGEKDQALAVQARIKDIIDNIATGNTAGWTKTTGLSQDTSGTAGSAGAAAYAQARIQDIYDWIDDGAAPTAIAPDTSWVSAELAASKAKLDAEIADIKSDAVQYIKTKFPALNFNETTCSRDVGYIVDALGYDLMFGSNFLSIWNGMSYYRGLTSTGVVLANQLDATSTIIDFISAKARKVAAADAVSLSNEAWSDIISYIASGGKPIVVGTNKPALSLDLINGGKILQLNKVFLVAEATAYIANTFSTTVTASTGSSTDTFTCSSTGWMVVGDAIRFTGTTFGGVTTNTTYYVQSIVNGTTFKVSDTLGGAAIDLTTASGTMTVKYYYAVARCENDVANYIDAIAADMLTPGNYKSTLAARYYRSALTGSKLEDQFYVKNGCGLRNMTFTGLDGTSDGDVAGAGSTTGLVIDLAYGTKRPLAGAYVSLDPGWGPNDYRAWVTNKSTYVQNVTTFGTACVGQKIDGSLHNGGVDSIVSNDFTQVLSDGIGAWVSNLGRAELVSVFTYYNYIGYLAENGGKIRATNGNNSYGVYGSVSEGIDVTEVPVLGEISNRNAEADVRSVITDGTNVLLLEYGNAGSEYSEATYTVSGSGANAAARGDEFRDESIFQIRMTDPGDSSGTGGASYVTASNQAQDGNTTQITLAAADTNASSVYVGMAIYLVAGTGAGQYGYITAYNAGSKLAQVSKPSTGTAGWDHVVPGTPIDSALDVTTTYEISPRIEIAAPGFTKSLATLPSASNWTDVVFGNAYGSYTGVSSTGGSGSLATFDVIRRQGVYTVTVATPGVTYVVGNTLTISGASLGGTSPANDITVTVTAVSGGSSGVSEITYTGSAISPKYVAIASGTTAGAYSVDGLTWTAMTMPTATALGGALSNQWSAITYVVYNNIGRYVAVAKETSTAAYSEDGINWSVASLGDYADWKDIAGNGTTLVAIAESDSAANTLRSVSTNGGATWTLGTTPIGARAIAYGATRFVIIEGSFSNSFAYSTNGVTWTTGTLPANDDSTESNWVDLAYGNGRYVAISDSSAMAAYSLDGATWYKSNMPGTHEWTSVRYGQGVFYATTNGSIAASSPDGVTWTLRDSSVASLTITSADKDITSTTYTARTLPHAGDWSDVIWTGTKFVAVGSDVTGTGANAFAASSTDGETWTTVSMPETAGFDVRTVVYNGSNLYVAALYNDRDIYTSTDGVTWTAQNTNGVNNLPAARNWVDSAYGNGKFVIVANTGTNPVAYSADGTTWSQGTLANQPWSSIAQGTISGTHYFVTVSTTQQAAYSTDGVTWTAGNTLPSSDAWSSVAYGNGRFVTVAGDATTTTTKAAYSTNGTSWTAATMPGAAARWVSVTYGGGAFTAFAYNSNRTAYSTDGVTWVEGPALSSSTTWKVSAYGNSRNVVLADSLSTSAASLNFILNTNLFTTSTGTTNLAVNDRVKFSGTTFGGVDPNTTYYVSSIFSATQFAISTSINGSNFVVTTATGSMTATTSKNFAVSGLGNYQGTPRWVALGSYNDKAQLIRQGAQARARAYVVDEKISEIWMHEPGSGYTSTPTVTITDPNNIGADATVQVRIGAGALGQPTWTNRGTSYTASSVTITGNGYSDNYQVGSYVGFMNLSGVPKAGSNVQIAGIDDVWYRLVNVTGLVPTANGTYSATLQLSPQIGPAEAPEHASGVTIRRRYSQVRLTGHDFLDIGTGNYTDSNYPGLPINDPIPANETVVHGGGRVFWTSTDQDGNFRVGGLFNVEQSTGVATLNADAFNIAGLNELSLGSVALGGSGATITEFSTDPFFTQDSDNVIPTQRAIKAYITSQIGGGGSSLNVNTLTAGVIYIAGQTITTTTNQQININTKVNFKGGIVGDALVLNYFLLNK